MDNEPRRTAIVLSLLAVAVFIASALILRRLLPGPDTKLDYMVIGAVSVMFALASVFLAIMRIPHR
jgi:hypothetical protein